jgi:hypothetical protein
MFNVNAKYTTEKAFHVQKVPDGEYFFCALKQSVGWQERFMIAHIYVDLISEKM